MKIKLPKKHMLLLPYEGDKGIGLTKSLKRNLNKHLQVTFTGKKLSTQFTVKDRTKFENNMMLFILVNIHNRIVLIIILVNLLGESLSEL